MLAGFYLDSLTGRHLPTRAPARRYDAAATRKSLIEAAFVEVYRQGFRAASLDAILAHARVTKGALYHHFTDKTALGLAMIAEKTGPLVLARWTAGLQNSADAVATLQEIIRTRQDQVTADELTLGCPLNNLAQELSPGDAAFRGAIGTVLERWIDRYAQALDLGQRGGHVARAIDPLRVGAFLVSAIEGSYGLAKGTGSPSVFRSNLELIDEYLEGIRA
jgi:TetR/AcrR family transcriptional repressor of nem operon